MKWVLLLINFLVFVGELTRAIPFFIFKSIGVFFLTVFKKIKLPTLHIRAPHFKAPHFKPPHFRIRGILRRLFPVRFRFFLLGMTLTLIGVFLYQTYFFVKDLPSPVNIGKINYALSTHIYDRNGKTLFEIYRDQNRTPVKLGKLPKYVYQATVAIEDRDFYKHGGVSLFSGILRAVREIIITRSIQGGSTITQQLVKSSLLSPERSFERKTREILIAIWAEKLFTKNQILEMYLNQVPYGGSAYGIQEAARTYFGHNARDLTLSEAALLAGLPQAPSVYSPYSNPEGAVARRNEVLQKMEEQGYIDEATKISAQNSLLDLVPPKTKIAAPHFVFYVKSNLEDLYGIKMVEEGGLNVTTTLDLNIQNEVEKILREELDKLKGLQVGNGAVLVTRPNTGEILAMVGSSDYFAIPSGAFNVTTALRQPGSSIKPIMYSLALAHGYTAASTIDDSPISYTVAGSPAYNPVNYDGKFHGKVTLRAALANSYNVPAVKVLNSIGVDSFINQARGFGISTWRDTSRYGLSLTLGGGEVKMVDMSEAFGVFANMGSRVPLNEILSIDNMNAEKVYEMSPRKISVVSEGIAYIISDILSDNAAREAAFGPNSALVVPGYKVAAKTGTTNDKKDNWTIGYTPNFLVTVWVGNNDGTPMNPVLTSGITGAAPIWNRVMTYLLKNYSDGNQWYTPPTDIVAKPCFGKTEYFLKGTENTASCQTWSITPTPGYITQ